MTKVYLRAEDNEAGVTVEDGGGLLGGDNTARITGCVGYRPIEIDNPEASAVLLGLSLRAESKGDWSHVEAGLRRMLEAHGIDRFNELCDSVAKAWWKEGR